MPQPKTYSAKLKDVHDLNNLQEFALDPATQDIYNKLVKYAFVEKTPTFNLLYHAEKTGASIEHIEWVDPSKPIVYDLVGNRVNYTTIVSWSADNMAKPGLNGSSIKITTKDKLFAAGHAIKGPTDNEVILLDRELGVSEIGHTYECRAFSPQGYIIPAAFDPHVRYVYFSAPSSYENSITGPDTPYIGVTSAQTYMNDIRVSTHIGGALENQEVTVYEYTDESDAVNPTVKIFSLMAEQNLRNSYYEAKYNVINFGRDMNGAQKIVRDNNTSEILREAAGLYNQRGGHNVISTNNPTLEMLSAIVIESAIASNRSITEMDVIVQTGSKGYSKAMPQIRAMFGNNIYQNITPGSKNLTAGYHFTSVIMPEGFRITFVLDHKLDVGTSSTILMPDGTNASSHEWHVTNIGKASDGKPSLAYYYDPYKHDAFNAAYGFRNGSISQANVLMPKYTPKAGHTAIKSNGNMIDTTEFSMAGTFVLVDRDPYSSFVVRPAIANPFGY